MCVRKDEQQNMEKKMKLGNWEVYKADDKGHSWKWVANNNSEIHLFPTKQKAIEFVKVKVMTNQDTFYGIQNLAEEEALRRHEAEKGVA